MVTKVVINKAINVLLVGLLLLFLFSSNAKLWLFQQLISVGLFNAELKTESKTGNGTHQSISFSFKDTSGAIKTVDELKGKVVLINFWASWCPPCRAEMPSLNALYNKLKNDDRFVFLFISEDEDLTKAKKFLGEKNYSLPLVTSAGTVSTEIFTGTLPTTIVLNKEGIIVMKHEGMAGYNTTAFIDQLKSLL